ncbi:potassium channel subfamily K member 1-like isoform X2 [Pomacea canaliculata]|uniref:potassium channel subfamily K member 1-like isoform X2 n=1 Tax=Pomacea canaliculata TaxID=400727 RepID=UPI000D731D85|nr:potassium channel subfamily K member 1-like isoform X2 [Pomacea canaliculata]
MEGPQEKRLVDEVKKVRERFVDITQDCISDDELEQFIEKIVKAANRGVSAIRNVTMSEPNWSYGQAIFFAATVLTTIGYGRVTPLSDGGKGFCIVYAIIGIPLTLILFTALVERILIPVKAFLYFLFRKLGHVYQAFYIQLLHLVIMGFGLLVFFILIPAAIFAVLEPSWNYLDGIYYCFISLTTIGLGDYIPGDSADQPNRALYKVATTLYLLTGLVMMMVVLSVLYDIPELNLGFHFYLKSDPVDDERTRLKSLANMQGPGLKYTKQVNEAEGQPSGQENFRPGAGTYQSFQDKDIGEE